MSQSCVARPERLSRAGKTEQKPENVGAVCPSKSIDRPINVDSYNLARSKDVLYERLELACRNFRSFMNGRYGTKRRPSGPGCWQPKDFAMPLEIERKFLVANDGWRASVIDCDVLRDGLISDSKGAHVRVRLGQKGAWLTVKSSRLGSSRLEFEYDIARSDAEEMLFTVCGGRIVEKTRYKVDHAGSIWVIDVYAGQLSGIVLAEIELQSETQPFELPDWVGLEVTDNPRFHKTHMASLCRAAGRPLSIVELLNGDSEGGNSTAPPRKATEQVSSRVAAHEAQDACAQS